MPISPAEDPATLNPLKRLKLIHQTQKWGHLFERKNLPSFFDEEFRANCGRNKDHLLGLLQGDALLEYQNSHKIWDSWANFCEQLRNHFLPLNYQTWLKYEINDHSESLNSQQSGEIFPVHVSAMLIIMHQTGGYSEH